MDVALQSSVWVTSPEFAGWLLKRGFHWRKLWKRRWVALHGAEIVYMDKEPTLENSSNLTITKANITAATVVEREDIDGNPNGFAIHVNDGHSPVWYLRAESSRDKKSWLMRLAHVHAIVKWLEDFEKVRILGVGGTGIVYELLHKSNGQKYAMKEMEIKNKPQMEMAIQEAEMLKDIMEHVSHPNIMHIEKVFQVGSKFYLVFPLCTGGELYEHIIRRGHFTENDASIIFRDLISGLHALHSHEILHLDIKPENILFENNEPNAKIKITDFGLSKMFSNINEKDSKMPTMDEINERLKAFQESGVLDRDRLRGTVGYMAPELILMGHSSKATDVFAAGVVLYILLCGHPPFQSKSNREILEKTAKGQYKMDGEEWEDVSDDAKDLVRKMLVVDPAKRISTTEILNHVWLRDDTAQPAQNVPIISSNNNNQLPKVLSKKGTNANLSHALKHLTGHVTQRRTEKLATGFTKLVSNMQESSRGRSSLLKKYARPLKQVSVAMPSEGQLTGSNVQVSDPHLDELNDEETMAMMNPDIKEALTSAIMSAGTENGKLSIPQFVALLKQLVGVNSSFNPAQTSSDPSNAPIQGHGLAFLLLCRFVDRDGDGYISADDIFTAQALVSQRSDIFLRAVFRIYTEAIWYPGRQLNFMHLLNKSTPKKGVQSSERSGKVIEETIHNDVVEPPKFITGRHVGAIFEKLGLDPQGGQQIFQLLCEAVGKTNGSFIEGQASEDGYGSNLIYDETDTFCAERDATSAKSPPRPIASPSSSSTSPTPNAALASALGGLSLGPDTTPPPPATMSEAAPNVSSTKMDVRDFIRACDIDDALVHVLLYRPRARLSHLLRRSLTIEEENEGHDSAKDSPGQTRRRATSVALENEFVKALRVVDQEKTSFPIAKAVTRATLSAAFGLAAKVTQGAQHLIEATYEGMEGGDDDVMYSVDEDES